MEMVNIIPICTVLSVYNPFTNTVPDSIDGKQSTYTVVDSQPKIEIVGRELTPSPQSYSEIVKQMIEQLDIYLAQQKEEEERLRLEEEERIRKLNEYPNKGYRQTYYSVLQDSETNLGSGYNYKSSEIKNINNVMHFNDETYGWLPVYAINMNEVVASGQNERGIWNVYGSVIEVTNGTEKWKGIVLDACGACRYSPKIDLWVYQNEQALDLQNLDFKYLRYGWNDYISE